MKVQRHFSLRFVLGFPLIFAIAVFVFTVKSHINIVNRGIDNEYQRIEEAIQRTTKVIGALDYSFTNQYKSGKVLYLDHQQRVVDGVCQIWPIDALLLAKGKALEIPSVDIDYMVVGSEEMCDTSSALYKSASEKISFAPILSFLFDIDEYHDSVYFIHKSGYVISSPESVALSLTKSLLSTIKARPYWQLTANNPDKVTLSGPSLSMIGEATGKQISMTIPVFFQAEHQGMLAVSIDSERLLNAKDDNLSGRFSIINYTSKPFPPNAIRTHKIDIEGIVSNHALYYELNYTGELKSFLYSEKNSLIMILIISLFLMTFLFYINSNVESDYFKELAAKDPMTGLLNRRGLEAFWATEKHSQQFVLVVFDIDDFKSVNDTYGHDKGDEVIRFMAKSLKNSVRNSDVAARFGGEEFVVYLRGDNTEQMHKTLERVKKQMCEDSTSVLPDGFTISGGVYSSNKAEEGNLETLGDFEEIFKVADEKLYSAKNSGKNSIVF
ncbi:GGDEF domain-containing protein [Vibrio gallaecicus]|uniref:diguanylate cyclase n=1 Tax=Vibrio gallaecicus TaxID=552386 RepID=A0ABV4NG68_9VIBR